MVTLTGPGGTGKTRLALEAAAQLASKDGVEVYLIELASLSDPTLIISLVAEQLGVKQQTGEPLQATVLSFLRTRQALLLLDNFEHLLAAAVLVSELLQGAPDLTVLATSRERLHLYGEQEYLVAPLGLPTLGREHNVEHVLQSESGQLFVQRAQAVRPDFELTDENANAVAEICRLLDGVPLALELAAARVRLFSPRALLARLQGTKRPGSSVGALALLTGGARDQLDRHRTLRNTIEWSYRLLPQPEQRLFCRLAVFTGSFTLEAASAVVRRSGEPGLDVLDGITALLDKSIMQREPGSEGEASFSMLQTLREFALERLEESGEAETFRRYHAEHYLSFAEIAAGKLRGGEQALWLQRLQREESNLRSALHWCEQQRRVEMGLRLATALFPAWYMRGQASEGLRWLESVLSRSEADGYPVLRARALCGAGGLASQRGDYLLAQSYAEESLALARPHGDKWSAAVSLVNLAAIARYQSDYQTAQTHAEAALAAARQLGDKATLALALVNLGVVAKYRRNDAAAVAYCQEGLELARELDDMWTASIALTTLGTVARYEDRFRAAESYYREALEIARRLGDRWIMAIALPYLGVVATARKEYRRARSLFQEHLEVQREVGLKREIATALGDLAALEVEEGYFTRAVRLWGAAEALRSRIQAVIPPTEHERYQRVLTVARKELGEESFEQALTAGEAMSVEEALAYAFEDADREGKPPSRATRRDYPAGLTPREVDVLRLVADGLTDAQVAQALVISPRTVNAHLTSVYRKLDVNSRTAASRFAIEQGLLEEG